MNNDEKIVIVPTKDFVVATTKKMAAPAPKVVLSANQKIVLAQDKHEEVWKQWKSKQEEAKILRKEEQRLWSLFQDLGGLAAAKSARAAAEKKK